MRMSLISALEEKDKTPSHGWSNANRFSMDSQHGSPQQQYKQQQQQQQKQFQQQQLQQKQIQQQQQSARQQLQQQRRQEISSQNKQHQVHTSQQQQWSRQGGESNIYSHLISQNNLGEVPDALVEEEIALTESPVSTAAHFQSTPESRAMNAQTKTVHHGSPRGQAPMVIVSVAQPGVLPAVIRPQTFIKQGQNPQAKNFQPQYVQSSPVNQGVQLQTVAPGQQQVLQIQQTPVQVSQQMIQEQIFDKEIAANQKQIEENNRQLLMYQQLLPNATSVQQLPQGLQQLQSQTGINQSPNTAQSQNVKFINYNINKVPVQSRIQGANSNTTVGLDYVGSMRFPNSGDTSQPNSAMRTLLLNSAQNTSKVDVQFLGNSGTPNRHVQETNQVITLSNNRPQQSVQGIQAQTSRQSNSLQKVTNQGIQTKGINPIMSPDISQSNMSQMTPPNQGWNSDATKDGTAVIDGTKVELKGGGKFEEGQVYLVRNKHGQEKKMIWTGKQLVEIKGGQSPSVPVTNDPTSPVRGGLARGAAQSPIRGQGRGRGARGRGQYPSQLQGNATGLHMTQQGGGQLSNSVQGQAFSPGNQTSPVLGQMIRPVRAQTGAIRQQGPLVRAQMHQPRVQVIQTQVGLRPGMPRQPMIINTSNLMPPAQGSQKLVSGSKTNLARTNAGAGDSNDRKIEGGEIQTGDDGISDRLAGGDKSDSNSDGQSDVPKHIIDDPDLVACCQFCGITSQNRLRCERCGRKFNANTKFFSRSDPEAKRRKIESDSALKTDSAVTKRSFYGQKLQEQNQIYRKVLSINGPGVTVRGVKKIRGVGDLRGRGRGLARGQGRIRGMHLPETVTISSDEEEEGSEQSSKPGTPMPQSHSSTDVTQSSSSSQKSTASSDIPESPIIPSIPISSKVDNRPRVDKMEDEKGVTKKGQREKSPSPEKLTVYLHARTVRVGTYRGAPVEPIQLSDEGIDFYLEGIDATHKFQIYPREIQQCLARFGKGTCLLFFLTTVTAGDRVRMDLGIPNHTDPNTPLPEIYFDPTSHEMCYQMITVMLDVVDNKTVYEFGRVMEIYRKCGHVLDSSFYLELNDEEADEVLKQSTKLMGQQNNVGDQHYTFMEEGHHSRSPSPPKMGFVGPIVKLLTYPPPPAVGGISITNEDLYCLQEGEFLNDVIIDFYLKYLLLEKLSEADKKRTHIFSSFFWKRLTQRVRALDDDGLSLPVKRHARVKTWTRNVDLFKKDFVIVPINEHAHWFLAIICYPGIEEISEISFIPKPHTAPMPPELSIPTPPEPRDDEEDMDMDEMDSENPLPEGSISSATAAKTDVMINEASSENVSNKDNVKSDEIVKDGETEKSVTKTDSENSSETTKQIQDSDSSEVSQATESAATSQSTDSGGQEEEMDTSDKPTKNGKREPTPSRISPSSMLGAAGKADKAIAGDRIIRGQVVSKETIKSDKLKKGKDYYTGMKQPCIIVFDSLLGPSRSRVVQVLKEYLMVEWSNKKGGTEYNRHLIKGTVPKVPQQTNYSDCGIFMLQYVETFFEDPIQDFLTPMKGLYDWFSLEKIERKREELRDLIIGLKEKFESKSESKENT